jgi:hypothetical protein
LTPSDEGKISDAQSDLESAATFAVKWVICPCALNPDVDRQLGFLLCNSLAFSILSYAGYIVLQNSPSVIDTVESQNLSYFHRIAPLLSLTRGFV